MSWVLRICKGLLSLILNIGKDMVVGVLMLAKETLRIDERSVLIHKFRSLFMGFW
jgi:hypothetical protein